MKASKTLLQYTKKIKFIQNRLFVWIVIMPNILFLLYMIFFEAKRYEIYAEIILKSTKNTASVEGALPFLNNNTKNNELEMIKRFIHSYSLIDQLDKNFNLKEYYRQPKGIDPFSFYIGNNIQSFINYFERRIKVEIDKESSIMKINFNDYSAEMAFEILNEILLLSETFINKSSEDLLNKHIEIAEIAAKTAMDRIKILRSNITDKQLKYNSFSPAAELKNLSETITMLEADLLKQQSSLAEMEAYLNPKSIQILTTKQKIININNKMTELKSKLINKDKIDDQFLTVDFGALEVEMELLLQEYKITLGLFEQSKLNILSNTEHIIVITPAFVTDYAKYPQILYNSLLSLFVTFSLFIIIKIARNIIKEHEGF